MPVEDHFPEPLVFNPASGIHKHTVILLHGRGGSADAFGPALLNTALPVAGTAISTQQDGPHGRRRTLGEDNGVSTDASAAPSVCDGVSAKLYNHISPITLAQALPHARFVFPTAPKQRATVYKRSIIRQWFDDWHLGFVDDKVDSRYDLGLQTTGLGSTVEYLYRLIAEEARLVGDTRKVILGGISQGCVASLVALLLWKGEEELGGVVGMCGWLPYISQMRAQLVGRDGQESRESPWGEDLEEGAGFDPFERSASPDCDMDLPGGIDGKGSVKSALEWLRGELDILETQSGSSDVLRGSVPAMLCHGQDDDKVDIAKASENAEFLPALGLGPLRLKEYAGVGHEFSSEMLSDIAVFIQGVLGEPSI
ncbi:hypothetical protein N8I77_009602 [Diaporthe amygdali]|uniref:Phospholipase/carboxylesterase/thioesterase domain-containing protein n=1 Tax=Phomopsis amygdali TaxID=1214568 RepID=A0AAD9SAH8_PHOAM|nr:hypothetical protein N8I77_009602 [Diaporthe amygdali]